MVKFYVIKNSHVSSLYLAVTSVLEEIQLTNDRMNTARGRTLEWLKELFSNDPYKYKFYSIQDDRCFKFVKYFDSTSSVAINVLIENLESLLSLNS